MWTDEKMDRKTDRPDEVYYLLTVIMRAYLESKRYRSKINRYRDQSPNSDMWRWYNEPTTETSLQTHHSRDVKVIQFTKLFFPMVQQPRVGRGLLIIEASQLLRSTNLGRTPLDEWSARCRDHYLTTHNTRSRQTSVPPVGFEPAIPASERPQTHTLDLSAAWIGLQNIYAHKCVENHEGFISVKYYG